MSSKYFITNLCELRPNMNESCKIVYTNSTTGTVSSIHNSIRCSCSNQRAAFNSHPPISAGKENKSLVSPTIKHRSRSTTPKRKHTKKSVQMKDPWPVFQSATVHRCPNIGDHAVNSCIRPSNEYPMLTSSTGKIPNANTKNLRSCSCVSAVSAPSAVNHRSVIHPSFSLSAGSNGYEHLCGSVMVSELKNDLEKVKSQLDQIADRNNESIRSQCSAKQVYQIRSENKKLRKELEQKKVLYHASLKQIDKLKDILNEYERKVTLLHGQAMKSAKIMKHTKDKFCSCLKEKENLIKQLKESNGDLGRSIEDKENQCNAQNQKVLELQKELQEKSEQNSILSDTNQNFCECIRMLETQLENSTKENSVYKKLEQMIADYKCNICEKLEHKLKKQREKYEQKIRDLEAHEKKLSEDIGILTKKVDEAVNVQTSMEIMEKERIELKAQLSDFEQYVSRCKILEDDCAQQCRIIMETEEKYNTDREELRKLVNELTSVVKENKVTLLHLSAINKQQEEMLISQSEMLLKKDEDMKKVESEITMLRTRSRQLEETLSELRMASVGPCNKPSCIAIMEELENLKSDLIKERDNQLLKEKIIEDQSVTIGQLQNQVREKTNELNKALKDGGIHEEELAKLNNTLLQKHIELEKELSEKRRLTQKLRKLEQQKSALTDNLSQLEKLVDEYCTCHESNEYQRLAFEELQRKVAMQKQEWETQKSNLALEKDKAVKAAKFATQKLIDTVSDFQKEVNAQKKVQVMLTQMLHDKEEELQNAKERISSINSLSNPGELCLPIDELFRNQLNDISEPATTISYSSWSNSSKNNAQQARSTSRQGRKLKDVLQASTKTDEPIRDIS